MEGEANAPGALLPRRPGDSRAAAGAAIGNLLGIATAVVTAGAAVLLRRWGGGDNA